MVKNTQEATQLNNAKAGLWKAGYDLSVVFLTGDYESGKTSFVYNIDPTPGAVIAFDMEKGNEANAVQYGAKRIDMVAHMREKYPAGYKPEQLYIEMRDMFRALEAGKHTVAMIDTITPLEDAVHAYVVANPGEFGMTAQQVATSAGMKWGQIKRAWESLIGDIASKVQTLCLIAHLRQKYAGGKPLPNQYEPRGLETVMQLASLALWLKRDPNEMVTVNGKQVKAAPHYPKPSASVLKSRIFHKSDKLDEYGDPLIIPVLPPRLPVATPGAIRRYINEIMNPDALSEHEAPAEFVPGMNESPDDRQQREAELTALKLEEETKVAKQKLVNDMTAKFPKVFSGAADIGAALVALEKTYSLVNDMEIRAALTTYAEAKANAG